MATISTMAIRILTQHAEAVSGLAAVGAAALDMASNVARSSATVKTATAASDAAADGYRGAAGEVAKFTGKLIGVATAAAAASKAIQMSATEATHKAYDRLAAAVERAFRAFGDSFSKSAGLTQLLDAATAAVNNMIGVLSLLGRTLGAVFGWVAAYLPVLAALTIAVKTFTTAVVILVHILITRWIVAKITMIFLDQALTPLQLAQAAATWALAAAYSGATVACNLLNAAMTYLALAGLPIWATFAIIALVIVALVAAVYGLVKAWQYFTSTSDEDAKIAKLDELQEKMSKLSKAAGDMTENAFKAVEQFGMSDIDKKVDDFVRANQDLRRQEGDFAFDERVEVYRKALEQLKAMETQQKAIDEAAKAANQAFKERQKILEETVKMQDDLDKKLAQAGMTENEKALADFTAKLEEANLLTDKQKTAAIAQYEATLDQIAAEEKRLEIEKQIADLQKSAAQAGMTEAQKKIADLQAAGATAIQIAQAQAALDAKAATEEKAKMMERGKQLKESLATPADEYKKKINEIGKLLAAGAIDPITAMNAADAATKALEDANKAAGAGRDFASPAALLKGSAEAALAEDRQKTPFDRLTDLQRKQLSESQKLTGIAKQQLDAQIKGGVVVNIP